MKRLIFLMLFGFCVAHTSKAQVKIGDNPQNINASSVLELESTDKVLVITRVTTAQMNAISPLQGAMVYNTDVQGVHYYDGTQWVNIGGGGGTGGPLTADAIVNAGGEPTIVITPTATGDNLEVAPNSISTAQIAEFGINGTTDIQPESIGVGKLAEDVITEFELSENSVGPLQIQNQNIDLGDFNNAAGYITAADVVSADAGNDIESRADGVFYDDESLLTAINQNTDAILLDDDQSSANEIQNMTLDNTTNILSLSGTTTTVDLSPYAGAAGNPTDELTDINFNTTTNILTLTNPATAAGGTVNLSSLAGGGADGSETIIDPSASVLVAGTGTTLDPYVLTAVGGGGGGTTEVADQTTISGIGTAGDPFTIEPGGNGEVLSTDATGNVVWTTAGAGGGTTEEVDGIFLTGTGTSTDQFTIAPGGADQILRTNAAGDAVAWVPLPTGAAAITDTTIDGDGSSVATALGLADEAVTIEKIAPGAADQILRTNAAGDAVAWVPLPTGAAAITDATIDGDGSSVATAIGLADAAVTLEKIAPNGATADGDIIQWNTDLDGAGPLTDAGWEVVANAGHTGEANSIFFADAVTGAPTQFFHPITDRPSFYWDPNGRSFPSNSYGALAIGVDGDPQGGVLPELSNEVKVHIAEKLPASISYSLLLHNSWDTGGPTTGSGVGMLFASDRYNDGKGALVFERRDNWGVGDFHFLQNIVGARQAPVLATDKAFTITRDKNIILYGDLFDKNDNAATPTPVGHVLTNTVNGTEWAPAGGLPTATTDGQILTWDADATATAGAYVVTDPQAIALDAANDQIDITQTIGTVTTETSSVNLDGATLEVFDNATPADATDDVIRIKPGIIDLVTPIDQVLVTDDVTGNVEWQDLPSGSTTPADSDVNDGLTTYSATAGYNVNVDNSTIELATDALQIKDAGVTAAKIAPATALATPEKQILVTNPAGTTVAWEALPGGITNTNLATDNLTQDAEPRTYDMDNQTLTFLNAKIGIGTGTLDTDPDVALHIHGNGQVRAASFKAANGLENLPSYRFTSDVNSGMWLPSGGNQLAFSTEGSEVLRIDENQNVGVGITDPTELLHVNGNMRLDGNLLDENNQPGTPNQILISTATGVDWVNQAGGPAAKGRVVNSVASTPTSGLHSVTFPTALDNDQYIINLTAEAVSEPIFINVVSQSTTGFTVKITEFNGTILTNLQIATWHYIVYNP